MNWKLLLTAMLKVAAKNDVRYYFNGVHIKRDADVLTIEATDGHMLLRVTTPVRECDLLQPGEEMIICRKSLTSALKLPEADLQAGPTYSGLSLTVVDGRYPDTRRLINRAMSDTASADKKAHSTSLMVKINQGMAGVLKAFGTKFDGVVMTQSPADSEFLWAAKLDEDGSKLEALLMPMRM